MHCDREEILSRFIDNDLSAQETTEFRAHLAECTQCKAQLNEIQESEKALQSVIQGAIPSGRLADRVLVRLEREMPGYYPEHAPKPVSLSFSFWKFLAPALALALVVLVFRPAPPSAPVNNTSFPIATVGSSPIEMMEVLPKSRESWAGDQKLVIGESITIDSSIVREFNGLMALCFDPSSRSKITWDGKGVFSARNHVVKWNDGNGEFRFDLNRPLSIEIDSVKILVHGSRVHISGKAGISVKINLIEGRAHFSTPYGEGELQMNRSFEVKQNRVEVAMPESVAGGVFKPFSPVLHPHHGILAPETLMNGWKIERTLSPDSFRGWIRATDPISLPSSKKNGGIP
jgi:hypothetical protein